MPNHRSPALALLLILSIILLTYSGLTPFDRTTWLLETFPIMMALPVLLITYRRFPLTSLLYLLIFCHAMILMMGGAYSYARVPLGFQIQDLLHLSRNPYDKIGHFFQGLVPTMLAREILIRLNYLRERAILNFLLICIALAISASYELFEWGTAICLGQNADEFLGTQGDPWDTQSDMFLGLTGSITAIFSFSPLHDRQLQRLTTLSPKQPRLTNRSE